jgi:MFS family permease
MRKMQKVRKRAYITIYIAGILFFGIFLSLGSLLPIFLHFSDSQFPFILIPFFIAGLLCLYAAIVAVMMVIYKMWAAIEGPSVRTTPGKAVGFLFIPLFNLYWTFQAYWGWAKDYNKVISERQINAPLMPTGLAMTIAIIHIFTFIPYIGWLFFLVNFILMIIFLSKACNCINALCDVGFEPQSTSYPVPNTDAKTSKMAAGSLILGICGLVTAGLSAIIGLILGIYGLNFIKKSNGQLKGRGIGVSGIIVSSIMLAVAILIILLISIAIIVDRNIIPGQ